MSYIALVDSFSGEVDLPVHVNQVLAWIRQNTDHKNITLHGVTRNSKSYRGGFRRRAVNIGVPYSQDSDDIIIYTDVLFGTDLPEDWKRLVIVKEVIHVFDGAQACVDSAAKLEQLIPNIITRQLTGTSFLPAVNDQFGAFRAMAVLLPKPVRERMKVVLDSGDRTVEEIASFCQLPEVYVDIWINHAELLEALIVGH
ncbi:hypothetical protein G6L87_03135 [Agrobacterium rhizogenes]|nr:hypothetical protein [Rhizobium rhizogenes]